MEAMLRINSYGTNTFESITYERAMELFLTEFPDGEVRRGKRRLAGYVVTGRATPRCPRHIGLTLSDSEEEEETLIRPGEDIDATSYMSSSEEESESDEEF